MSFEVLRLGMSRGITSGDSAAAWAGKTSAQTSGRLRKCWRMSAACADTYLDISKRAVGTATSTTTASTAVTA